MSWLMTRRRTKAQNLRSTISELLEQLHALEHSMQLYEKKSDPSELERAAQHFNEMLGYVDRLGEMIADLRAKQRATPETAN
jgi:polyhydroxyalkanoate synthesis regulator phasin